MASAVAMGGVAGEAGDAADAAARSPGCQTYSLSFVNSSCRIPLVHLTPVSRMRIATWNLARPRPTGRRARALLEHVASIQADLWVLTETHVGFHPGPSYRMVASSAPAQDRTPSERWTMIWAREELAAASVATADDERTACARLVMPDGRPLHVYGTVLPWLSDRRRHPLKGAASFAVALAEQGADWRRLRDVEPAAALCVAGDLNQDLRPTGHYYGSAAGRAALRAALEGAGLTCLTGGDRDPVARFGGGRASIDHVCVAGLSLADGDDAISAWPAPEHVGRRLSDHHGVVVDLEAGPVSATASGSARYPAALQVS